MPSVDSPVLDIVGGGYDHLAPLSRAGAAALAGASVVAAYAGILPGLIRKLNPGARLVPWGGAEELVAMLGDLPGGMERPAVLLGDGVACPRLLAELIRLASAGVRLGYYPAMPLAEAARRRAGFHERGKAVAVMLEPGGKMHSAGSRSRADRLRVVGFDGRVLWPVRQVAAAELESFSGNLPPGGVLFAVEAPEGATPDMTLGLAGRGVVVTRSLDQADEIGHLLLAAGAAPLYFPVLELAPPPEPAALDRMAEELERYDAVILTSTNSVQRFVEAILARGRDLRSLAGLRLMAVGARTAEALAGRGLKPDAVPADFRAEGLIGILEAEGVAGKRFLMPRAEEGRDILPQRVRELGGEIEVVTLYRTVEASPDPGEMDRWLGAGVVDAVTFTSGSTFRHFEAILGPEASGRALGRAAIACLGPVTADAVRAAGRQPAVTAARSTVEDLVAALETHFRPDGAMP